MGVILSKMCKSEWFWGSDALFWTKTRRVKKLYPKGVCEKWDFGNLGVRVGFWVDFGLRDVAFEKLPETRQKNDPPFRGSKTAV